MHVELGPIESSSVIMWIAYARTVLAQQFGRRQPVISVDIIEEFERYLDDWDAAAARSTEFRWEGEVDTRQAKMLAEQYFNLVRDLDARTQERGYSISPQDGEPFYRHLVQAMVEAFEHERDDLQTFAEHLRNDWPGLDD
jgi:hypothetical protein